MAVVQIASARVLPAEGEPRLAQSETQHAALCTLAAKWLKSPNSRGGHGCQIAFTEAKTGYLSGEIPDAIGFRIGYLGGSILVECKTSRSDFLADRRKPHRVDGAGMGKWRYYLAPEGILSIEDFEGTKWGLLVVGRRGAIRCLRGAASHLHYHGLTGDHHGRFRDQAGDYVFDHDVGSENRLLINLLHRVGAADALNTRLRNAEKSNSNLVRLVESLRNEVRDLKLKNYLSENEHKANPFISGLSTAVEKQK